MPKTCAALALLCLSVAPAVAASAADAGTAVSPLTAPARPAADLPFGPPPSASPGTEVTLESLGSSAHAAPAAAPRKHFDLREAGSWGIVILGVGLIAGLMRGEALHRFFTRRRRRN